MLFGPDMPADPNLDSLHELHAATEELDKTVNELHNVMQPLMDAQDPLVAMVVTILNERQWRTPDDVE